MAEINNPLQQVLQENLQELRKRNYYEGDLRPGGVLGLYEGLSSPNEEIRKAAADRFGVRFVPNESLEKGMSVQQKNEAAKQKNLLETGFAQGNTVLKNIFDAPQNINNVNNQTRSAQNEQNLQENIFGERLAQALFPGINQDNKQLINAAILRGSLELLKPRQPGENLASQLGRGLEAGTQFGKDIQQRGLEALATQAKLSQAQAALQKAKLGKQVSVTKEKREAFGEVIDTIYDTDPTFKTTVDLIKQKVGTDIGSDLGDDQRRAIELEAMSINASTGLGVVESTKIAAQNFLTGQKSIPSTSGEDIDADVTEQ